MDRIVTAVARDQRTAALLVPPPDFDARIDRWALVSLTAEVHRLRAALERVAAESRSGGCLCRVHAVQALEGTGPVCTVG